LKCKLGTIDAERGFTATYAAIQMVSFSGKAKTVVKHILYYNNMASQ